MKYACAYNIISGITLPFERLYPSKGQVGYVLLTRLPLSFEPKLKTPFDLHVLSLYLAFILLQDQTLLSKSYIFNEDIVNLQ